MLFGLLLINLSIKLTKEGIFIIHLLIGYRQSLIYHKFEFDKTHCLL